MPSPKQVVKLIKVLLTSFTILVLLSLSACCTTTPVTVEDHTLYYQKQASFEDWAVEMHFLTDETHDLSKAQWDAVSESQVCMPLKDWGDINQMIAEFCSVKGVSCNYEIKQALNLFFGRLSHESQTSFPPIE